MKFYGSFLIFIAAILWATDAPFRTLLVGNFSSTFIVFGEHVIATLVALPLIYLSWHELKQLTKKEWYAVVFIAICGSALATIAFTQSFHYVNPSVAILLQKLQPLVAIVLATFFLGETLHRKFFILGFGALVGAYLISFPNLVPQVYAGEVFNPNIIGVTFALVAAVFWATGTVLGKYVLSRMSFKLITGLRFTIALAFLGVITLATDAFPAAGTFSARDAVFIGIIALVSGVFSLLLYYKGLQTTPASVATLAELGFPVGAVIVNWLFIPNSALTVVQMGGIALLLACVWGLRSEQHESKAP